MTLAERIQAVLGGLVVFLVVYTLAERATAAEDALGDAEQDYELMERDRDQWRVLANDLLAAADDPTGSPIVYGVMAFAGLLLGLGIALVIGL